MRKTLARPTTLYTFAQRTDLLVSRHTADLLTEIALWAARMRKKIKDEEFQKLLLDYGLVSLTCIAAGMLTSLLTVWFM